MDKTLFESLKKSLHEAIEHAKSQYIIRTLQPKKKLPMDLLLLAYPSNAGIEKYIYKSKVFVVEEDALVVGVYVLLINIPFLIELCKCLTLLFFVILEITGGEIGGESAYSV